MLTQCANYALGDEDIFAFISTPIKATNQVVGLTGTNGQGLSTSIALGLAYILTPAVQPLCVTLCVQHCVQDAARHHAFVTSPTFRNGRLAKYVQLLEPTSGVAPTIGPMTVLVYTTYDYLPFLLTHDETRERIQGIIFDEAHLQSTDQELAMGFVAQHRLSEQVTIALASSWLEESGVMLNNLLAPLNVVDLSSVCKARAVPQKSFLSEKAESSKYRSWVLQRIQELIPDGSTDKAIVFLRSEEACRSFVREATSMPQLNRVSLMRIPGSDLDAINSSRGPTIIPVIPSFGSRWPIINVRHVFCEALRAMEWFDEKSGKNVTGASFPIGKTALHWMQSHATGQGATVHHYMPESKAEAFNPPMLRPWAYAVSCEFFLKATKLFPGQIPYGTSGNRMPFRFAAALKRVKWATQQLWIMGLVAIQAGGGLRLTPPGDIALRCMERLRCGLIDAAFLARTIVYQPPGQDRRTILVGALSTLRSPLRSVRGEVGSPEKDEIRSYLSANYTVGTVDDMRIPLLASGDVWVKTLLALDHLLQPQKLAALKTWELMPTDYASLFKCIQSICQDSDLSLDEDYRDGFQRNSVDSSMDLVFVTTSLRWSETLVFNLLVVREPEQRPMMGLDISSGIEMEIDPSSWVEPAGIAALLREKKAFAQGVYFVYKEIRPTEDGRYIVSHLHWVSNLCVCRTFREDGTRFWKDRIGWPHRFLRD